MSGSSSQLSRSFALLAIVSSVSALAADKRPRVVVFHLETDPGTSGQAVDAAIAKRLGEQGFDPVLEESGTTTCAEAGCFAKLVRDRGASYLVRSALIAQDVGGTLTLTVLDKTGQALSEISKTIGDRSTASLEDAVEEEVPKLVQPLRDVAPAMPAPAETVTAPERSHVASYALMVSGAALLLASGAVGYAADNADSALDNAVSGEAPGNIPSLRSSVSTEAWVSTGLTLAGVAAIAVGVVLFYTGRGSGAPEASAAAGAPTLAWGF